MNIDTMVERARPAQAPGWADSPAGRAVLSDVLSRTRATAADRRRRRIGRLVAVGVTLGIVGIGAVATAVGFGGEPPEDWTVPEGNVACGEGLVPIENSNLAVFRPKSGVNALDACRDYWQRVENRQAPEPLVACVVVLEAGRGGGLIVMPAPGFDSASEACRSVRMYTAPQESVDNPRG